MLRFETRVLRCTTVGGEGVDTFDSTTLMQPLCTFVSTSNLALLGEVTKTRVAPPLFTRRIGRAQVTG
jgi:hypothetical protein